MKISKRIETNSEEIEENRYRHFMLLLYKDTTSYKYDDVLQDMKGSFKNYAYIEHKPEDDEKKKHTHVILSFDNARTISSLSKRVGIPHYHIKNIKSLRQACRYLTHRDDEDKIQYDLTDCVVSRSFSRKFYGAYDDLQSEEDIIDDIYNFIDSICFDSYHEAIKQLIVFVNKCDYDTIYKRYRLEFIDYLKSKISVIH